MNSLHNVSVMPSIIRDPYTSSQFPLIAVHTVKHAVQVKCKFAERQYMTGVGVYVGFRKAVSDQQKLICVF